MIRNVFEIIVALIIGYVVGLFSGGFLGVSLATILNLFFYDIVYSNQTLIILSLFLGGILGAFAILLGNQMFGERDKSLIGALAGAIIGFFIIFFMSDVIHIFNSEGYYAPTGYSIIIGRSIGATVFPIFNVARVVRDYIKERNYKRRENEHQNELPFYQSKSLLDGKK